MFFRQIYDEGLAQASYLIGSDTTGEALVVDPRRDVYVYTALAARHDLRITAVAETHIHADYLSGGRELAATTAATLFLSGLGDQVDGYLVNQPDVRTKLVRDGDEIRIGEVRARVRHTPGHTPEHICFEIFDGASKTQPMMLLSGDFFFVGDLGRPDLLEQALGKAGAAETCARDMFASVQRALGELPDFVAIWPAHGAGSACGRALGAVPSTTLGYERRFSWWSQFAKNGDEHGFVHALLDAQPDAPTYFARMKHDNRGFAPLLHSLPKPELLDAAAMRVALERGAVLVDARPREEFCRVHVKGALSVPDRTAFAARAAWFVKPDQPLVLLARPERVGELVRALVRVGLDAVIGYVTDVQSLGLPTASLEQVTPEEAQRRFSAREVTLVDVRQDSEFAGAHVPNSTHVSAGKLAANLTSIPRDRPIVIFCAGGDRSVAAASVLYASGFENVANMRGGFDEWQSHGLPTESGLIPSARSIGVGSAGP